MKTISLAEVVRELNETVTPEGTQKTFAIKFVKKGGEVVYLNRAVKTGLKMDMTKHAMRGVRPVDEFGQNLGHVYPVLIWSILEFNGKRVYL
ncbi:hypothetical protein DF185_19905 [Marinifilum breve]|uniref:Uncharacterized protein n=1 Tax=Marinifilum breve TaxID=2184082 RepID=A0A2V3ZT93_9BACT|nr:hypothetical protein [Marinifilum breve]PXX96907.1 hypothetical protein DF185_19905 [Marinifilum breve]